MGHVFISYNQSDFDFATILKNQIEQAGFETWLDMDKLAAGKAWQPEIDQAIRDSAALVLVLTPEALKSPYISYEWAFALGAEVAVIPILLKQIKHHPRLDTLHYLDFTDPRSRPSKKLIERLQEVANTFSPYTIHVSRDTPLAIKQAVADLDSSDAAKRISAMMSLATLAGNYPEVREVLAQALQHSYPDVCFHSTFILASFKDIRAVPSLIKALHDKKNKRRSIKLCA